MASIIYVSSSTTDVITEIASTSEVIISNLQGPQGATGPQGPQGTPGGIASVVAPITNAGTETAAIIGINSSSANTANYVVQRDANKEFVAGAVTIDTTLTPTSAPGKLYWDGGGTVNLGLAGGNVSVALGENLVSYVTNAEATTLAVGEVVYVFGASGDRPSVKRASNASEITSSKTLGIVAESIGANQIGFVITRGIIGGLALGSYTEGAPVYLGSTAGTFTSTKPAAPANLVALGWVIRANNGNGQIYVNVQNGFELEELHNVLITSAANGNFLVYDSATTLWKNQAISATAPVTYNAGTRTIAANSATTSASGVVQLTDSTSSTSTTTAATPNAVKSAYDLANTANITANAAVPQTRTISTTAPLTGGGDLTANRTLGVTAASTSATGVVQLSDSTSTTSSILAATPTAVKAAYDLASTANATANAAIPLAQKAAANGVATLDASGLVPTNQLPALAITNTFVVNSQAAMLALTAQTGDVAIRTDLSESYILTADPASTLANWQELLSPPDAVTSVDGRVGAVTLTDKYAQLATANTFSGSQTATSFVVTGSTVPANGMYLPATNSLGFAVNSTVALQIASSGTVTTTGALGVGQNIGSSSAVLQLGDGRSADGNAYIDLVSDTTYTDFGLRIIRASGANGTASIQHRGTGVLAINAVDAAPMTIATSNLTRLTVGADGTVGLGSTNASYIKLVIGGTIGSSSASSFGVQSGVTFPATATTVMRSFYSIPSTEAATYTAATLRHFDAGTATIGAGSTLTEQVGFRVGAITGATNNYGFYGAVASAAGNWNLYATGTAANYFAGQTTVGSTSLTLGSGSVAQQFGVVAGAATTVGAVIRGAASATADLTQWQNSAGSVLSSVSAAGLIRVNNTSTDAMITSTGNSTYDAFRFRNGNGLILWGVGASNNIYYSNSGAFSLTGGNWATGRFNVDTGSAGNVGTVVRGTTSQTADLAQFQDVSGNTLSSVSPTGTFVGNVQDSQLIQYGAEGSLLQNIPTRVHPAETLLKQAVWWIDSAHSGSSGQAIKNLGWGGAALDATAGSTTSADSNDPQYLEWSGVNYVYLPGVVSNYLSVPDSAALDITGDIDLRIKLSADNWTDSASPYVISKLVDGNKSYGLRFLASGVIRLEWSVDGTNSITKDSTVATGLINGTVKWVRVTLDVDNGASGNDVKFFLSDDGVTWTQLGSTVTTAGTTSIYAGTAEININGRISGQAQATLAAKIYRAQILNGIDGVPVLDVDTSVITSGSATSFTALTGQTVTINRATSGRKTTVVTHPVWLFGTDDYMEVNNRWLERTTANYLYLPGVAGNYASSPDSAALDITGDIDLRVKVAMDDWTPTSTNMLLSKYSSTAGGLRSYQLMLSTSGFLNLQWSTDGSTLTNNIASTAIVSFADGAIGWVRATLDVDNGASGNTVTFFTSTDGTTWTQLGAVVTTAGVTSIFSGGAQLEVGTRNVGTAEPSRGKFFRAQVLNGIGGTVAFDANFETGITTNLPTTFTESSANAATVTINYSGTGYRSAGVIASTYVFPGNPNTFKLSSTDLLKFGLTESFSALAIFRQWATTADKRIMSTGGAGGGGSYSLSQQSSNRAYFQVTDGVNFPSPVVNVTAGGLATLVGVKNVGADTLSAYINSDAAVTLTDTNTGSTTNLMDTFKIGSQTGGVYADMEFVSAAIFRRILTAAEIATLNSYFQGRVA